MHHLTYLLADKEGKSYFEDRLLATPEAHEKFPVYVTQLFSGKEVAHWHSDQLQLEWVNAPQRQCFVYLAGQVEMTAGSGEMRQFGAGDVLMVEDITGFGHCTRIQEFLSAIVIKI